MALSLALKLVLCRYWRTTEFWPSHGVSISVIGNGYHLIVQLGSDKLGAQTPRLCLGLRTVIVRRTVKAIRVDVGRVGIVRQPAERHLGGLHPHLRRVFHHSWRAAIGGLISDLLDLVKP